MSCCLLEISSMAFSRYIFCQVCLIVCCFSVLSRLVVYWSSHSIGEKLKDGKQWVYAADTDAVQSAQEAYDNSQYKELINVGEDLIETLEDIKDYIKFYDDYGNQILSTDFNTISETLTNQGIAKVDAFLKSKGIDIGAVDMSNLSSYAK